MKLLLLYFMISLVFGMKSKKKKKDCSKTSDCDDDSYCCVNACEREKNKCFKKHKNGEKCFNSCLGCGAECKSGRCARISTGRFEFVSKCKPLLSNGKECIHFRECKSSRCHKGRCKKSDIKDAEVGEFCYTGADCLSDNCQTFSEPGALGNVSVRRCAEKKKEVGERCFTDDDCLSKLCKTDFSMYVPTKWCAEKKEEGERCTIDADCLSNFCPHDKYPYFCAQKKKSLHRYFLE